MEQLRICLVSCPIPAECFTALGHETLCLRPKPGLFNLEAELVRQGFQPDLLVQVETLGPRTILQGLPELRCRKLYWSIDTHLNLFWQRHYAHLFDAVLTTQPHLVNQFTADGPPVHWLPWFGSERPWTPWAKRDLSLHFVGRVSEHRPARAWMIEHLISRFGAGHDGNLPYTDMLAVYDRTRIAPNEAIAGEINFRLFEAASCGCAVVTPDTGPGLADLFQPGEIATYTDVLELDERVGFLLRNPSKAERQARSGWERVRASHLPGHRAAQLLEIASNLPSRSLGKARSEEALVLTLHALSRDERLDIPARTLNAMLARLEQTDRVLRARLLLAAESLGSDHVRALAGVLLGKPEPLDTQLAAVGSLASAHVGDHELALAFWARHLLQLGPEVGSRLPRSPDKRLLIKSWAGELFRRGQAMEPGFRFDLSRHVPTTASECLLLALRHDQSDLVATRDLEAILAREPGTEATRLRLLSHLSLHRRDDWRLGLRLGLLNLRAFRAGPGLEELCLALDAARRQGKEKSFLRMLSGLDVSGRALKALLAAKTHAQTKPSPGLT